MTDYLVQIAIGPVQGFIAAARRTRDLWYGSWLLSELSKAAALQLSKSGGELIFPAPENPAKDLKPGSELNVANKIVAKINTHPSESMKAAEQAVRDRLNHVASSAFAELKKSCPALHKIILHEDIQKQLAAVLEIAWAAVPCSGQYATDRDHLETLMAARKATRDFPQADWGNTRPKSAIDGQAESIIDWDNAPKDETFLVKIESLGIKYKEPFAAIDLVKRFGAMVKPPDFLSLSHVAVRPYMNGLDRIAPKQEIADAWNTYLKLLPGAIKEGEKIADLKSFRSTFFGMTDGTLLFPERIIADYDAPHWHAQLVEAQKKLQHFLQIAKNAGYSEPGTYYALIKADGDSMGQLIDALANHENGMAMHREFTQQLDAFASTARDIIVNHQQGGAIYTGGDDVLALVPLHTLLKCLTDLKQAFEGPLQSFAKTAGKPLTMSFGVAIAHHLMPLAEVRQLAEKAEHRAKQVEGKGGLAIIVSKRSGSETLIAGKVDMLVSELTKAIDAYRKDLLPEGMGYEFRAMARRLDGPKHGAKLPKEIEDNILIREGQRIISRKAFGNEAERQRLKDMIIPPNTSSEQSVSTTKTDTAASTAHSWNAEEFANRLIVAKLLAQASELAEGPQTKGKQPA